MSDLHESSALYGPGGPSTVTDFFWRFLPESCGYRPQGLADSSPRRSVYCVGDSMILPFRSQCYCTAAVGWRFSAFSGFIAEPGKMLWYRYPCPGSSRTPLPTPDRHLPLPGRVARSLSPGCRKNRIKDAVLIFSRFKETERPSCPSSQLSLYRHRLQTQSASGEMRPAPG